MKKLAALLLAVLTAMSFAGCGKKEQKAEESSAVNVTVEKAVEASIENTVTYTGQITASESTAVSSKVSGIVKAVYKEVGDYVKEGETLYTIDDTDYRAALRQAQAAYNQAKASYNSITNGSAQQSTMQLQSALDSAKIAYNNAKTNYDNMTVLYNTGAISKTAYDSAVTAYENAKLSLNTAQKNYDLTTGVVLKENAQSAKATLESAQVAVDNAKSNLENTGVKAPISGYIASRTVNRGQMSAASSPAFTIKSTNTIEAQINVTESVIPTIRIGTKAVVRVDSADKTINGKVTEVSPTKDPQTGMYLVSVAISNKDNLYKDGMFAEVSLTTGESTGAIVVPAQSVIEATDGTKYVFVAISDNKAEKRIIETGIVNDEKTEIISGVKPGENVVVNGKEYLSDKNTEIKIVK